MKKTIKDKVKTIKDACQLVIDAPLPVGTKLSVEVVENYGNNEVRTNCTIHGNPASLTKMLLGEMSQDKDLRALIHAVQMCELHLEVNTERTDQDDLEPEDKETED